MFILIAPDVPVQDAQVMSAQANQARTSLPLASRPPRYRNHR
jgi:hypothetical protein